ncbi:hypothetical protein RGL50_004080 [Vibrio alginolyticus]|nr:hypothetical protein [Vibrio alginolyticus]
MITISLPINTDDLGELLDDDQSLIDMELAEKLGVSLIVGTQEELNDARLLNGLPNITSEQAFSLSKDDYTIQGMYVPLHLIRARYVASVIKAQNAAFRRDDMFGKFLLRNTGKERFDKLFIKRFPKPGKPFIPYLPDDLGVDYQVEQFEPKKSICDPHRLLTYWMVSIATICSVVSLYVVGVHV